MALQKTWPKGFWSRFAYAIAMFLPLCLVGFVLGGLILGKDIADTMLVFAIFGPAAVAGASFTAAALNAPGSPTPLQLKSTSK